jgi:hypothetical protein
MDKIILSKKCIGCGEIKPIECFYSKQSRCKECFAIQNKEYRINNKEKVAQYSKEWQRNNPEKVKIRNEKWRKANIEKSNAARRKWQKNNPDKIKKQDPEVARRWRANHPEKAKEVVKKYQASHPEIRREQVRKRRALKKGVSGEHFTEKQWRELLDFYGGKCIAPGEHAGRIERDHVIPFTKGGTDSIDNIQPLCKLHNIRKSNKTTDYRK